MAWPTSGFPTSIDSISDKTDSVDDVAAADINGAYDCIEKIEAKVGVNSSGVNTSLDYLLNNVASLDPGHKHSFASGLATLAASRAIVTGAGGLLEVSAVTATEVGYLDGVSSNIQTQIDNAGVLDTSGAPTANDFARFSDATTLEGRSYAEVKADLNLEIGTDVLAEQTIGIADDNLLEVDGSPNDNEYAKFTAAGLEGRTYAEVRTDLGLVIGTDVLAEQTIGILDDNLLEVDGAPNSAEYAKFTAAGIEGRTFAEMKVDLDLEAGTDFYSKTAEDTWRSNVTQTEMGYLDGVTSDIQTQLGTKKNIEGDWTLGSDHTYSDNSDVVTATAGENVAFGDICYLKSDGKWWKCDANVEAEIKNWITMATAGINAEASGIFLIRGLIRDDTWAWTVGAPLWVPEADGNPTETQPSDSGDFIKLVGWAKGTAYIWFDPDKSYGKVA